MKYLLTVISSATYLLLCGYGSACGNEVKNQTSVNKGRNRRMADSAYSDVYSGQDGDGFDRGYTNKNYRDYGRRSWGNRRSSAYAATGRGRGSGYGYGEGFVSGRGIVIGEGSSYGDRNGAAAGTGTARGVYVKEGSGYGAGYGYGYGDGSGRSFTSRGGYFEETGGKDSGDGRRRGSYSYRQRGGYGARGRYPYYGTEDDTGDAYGRGIYVEEGAVRGRGTAVSGVDDSSSDGRHKEGNVNTQNGGNYGTATVNNRRNGNDPRYGEESGTKSGKDVALGVGYAWRRGVGSAYGRGISVKEGTITGRGRGFADIDDVGYDSNYGDKKEKKMDKGNTGATDNNNEGTRKDSRYGEESGTKSGKDVALGVAHDSRKGYGSADSTGISVKEGTITGRGIAFANVDGIDV